MKKMFALILSLTFIVTLGNPTSANAEKEQGVWTKQWEVDLASLKSPYPPDVPRTGPDGTLYFLLHDKFSAGKQLNKLASISPDGKLNWVFSFTTKDNVSNHRQVMIPGDGYVYVIDTSSIGSPYVIHKIGKDGKLQKNIILPFPKKPDDPWATELPVRVEKDGTIRVAYDDKVGKLVHLYQINHDGKILWQTKIKKKDSYAGLKFTDHGTLIFHQGSTVDVYSLTGKILFQVPRKKTEHMEFFQTQSGTYVAKGYTESENANKAEYRLLGISKEGKINWSKKLSPNSRVSQYGNRFYYTVTEPGEYSRTIALVSFNPVNGKDIAKVEGNKYIDIKNDSYSLYHNYREYKQDPYLDVEFRPEHRNNSNEEGYQWQLLNLEDFSVFRSTWELNHLNDQGMTGSQYIVQGTKAKPYVIVWSREKIMRFGLR
jgi:hypothetical protein